MTDRGSSPEPDYPWTRYHRSEEQTTRDPDHWNASNRSRSESEDRDPNDDPYTYCRATLEPVQIQVTRHTYSDSKNCPNVWHFLIVCDIASQQDQIKPKCQCM